MRIVVVWLVVVVAAAVARADGGPPVTLQIHTAADRPSSLYVATNYGLMITHDGGCTFEWVCEPSVGYGGTYIPRFGVVRDGTIVATTNEGLRISRDDGCSFATATGGLPEGAVLDVTVGRDDAVWTTTSSALDGASDVYVSRDRGATFTAEQLVLPGVSWTSIRTDGDHAYVAGHDASAAHLQRRTSTGWTPSPLTGVAFGLTPRIRVAAVTSHEPDVVYVVSEGVEPAYTDRLYRSSDGGQTFTEVLVSDGLIRDVVIVDASTVIATQAIQQGVIFDGGPPRISRDGGRTFTPYDAPPLSCLTISPAGQLVGGSVDRAPTEMAVTRLDGDAWTEVWRFRELARPLACATDVCASMWSYLSDAIGPFAPTCGPLVPDESPRPSPDDGGCTTGGGSLGLASGLLALLLRRRR